MYVQLLIILMPIQSFQILYLVIRTARTKLLKHTGAQELHNS